MEIYCRPSVKQQELKKTFFSAYEMHFQEILKQENWKLKDKFLRAKYFNVILWPVMTDNFALYPHQLYFTDYHFFQYLSIFRRKVQ